MTTGNSTLLTATALLFAFFTGSSLAASAVPDWNMPGIPDAGFPHFQDSVKVTFARVESNWVLFATKSSGTHRFQYTPATSYDVADSSFSLIAKFDRDLNFTGGNVLLRGKVPGMGVYDKTTLWKSSLTGFGFDIDPSDGSPIALGFETSGHDGWATRFSSGAPESVYLFSPELKNLATNLSNHKGSYASVNATALTTVPVPAAAWLLGSGLMALAGMRRRGTASALAA